MSSSYSSLIDDDGDLDISLIEGPLLFSLFKIILKNV